MIVRIEGLYIPDSIDEARQIVPTITEEQFRKWQEDGAVELKVLEVYSLTKSLAFIGNRTVSPAYLELRKSKLREVIIKLSDEDKEGREMEKTFTYYLPTCLIDKNSVHVLASILNKVASTIAKVETAVLEGVMFTIEDMLKLLKGEEVEPSTYSWSTDEPEDVSMSVRLGDKIIEGWWLEPDKSYILKLQYVKIPPDLLPTDVEFRSSYHRCGWIGKVTNIDPGFEGHIYVTVVPSLEAPPLALEEGARVLQMRLLKLSEPLLGYRGQWKSK